MSFSRRQAIKMMAGAASIPAILPLAYAQAQTANTSLRITAQGAEFTKLIHCACYYPELWPVEDMDKDLAEMNKLGINTVRLGEFMWSTLEPKEGKINMRFLQLVMDKLHQAGIGVVVCTPTATPPVWLTDGHPERLFVNADGQALIHGARQHASYEHPAVRKACYKIVDAFAKALGDHPALIAWQIDNELKCHVAEDFSKAAINEWHIWLKKRFGTIEKLNEAWGTHMWSEYYQTFEQVPAPLKTPFMHSASLSTDYRIFNRERIAEFSDDQCAIIRKYSKAPITHNSNPGFSVSQERLFKNLDIAAYDAYPSFTGWNSLVFRSDLYRAAKPGKNFWLMETSASYNGWLGEHSPAHPAGFLAAEAALVFGLGSQSFSYWLWRQQRTGVEIAHSAIMTAWNKPSTGYDQVKRVEAVRTQMEPFMLSSKTAPAEIAITWSDTARAMFETEPMDKAEGFPAGYQPLIELWHNATRMQGYHRDVRFEGAALDGLKLLITPALPFVSDEYRARAENFVRAGGVWIIGPGTGTRDDEHTVHTDKGLGALEALAGIETTYIYPLTGTGATGSGLGKTTAFTGWCAVANPVDANTKVMGELTSPVVGKGVFFTERALGKGKVVFMGAHPQGDDGKAFIEALINHYAQEQKIAKLPTSGAGTVVCPRVDAQGKQFWVVVNMDGKGGSVDLPANALDAVTKAAINQPKLTVPAYEWRMITTA